MLEHQIEEFLDYCETARKCTPHTIRAYRNDLKLFAGFMEERGLSDLSSFRFAEVNHFIEDMKAKDNPRFDRTGLADSSIRRRLASVNSFFEYQRATNHPELLNPLHQVRRKWIKNNQPKPVDEVVLSQLLDGITAERDRLIVFLFLATGLRVSELHRLDRDTLRFEVEIDDAGRETLGGTAQIVGKGGKVRQIFVDAETTVLYARYLQKRTDQCPALFLSERGTRLSVRAIQWTLGSWCRRLGIPHTRVHQLRHSFATALANENIPSLVLQSLMGHKSLTTTQNYFKLHDSTLARGYHSAMEYVNHRRPVRR